MENLTFMFSSAEKRAMWEEAFNDAKHKLGEQEKNTCFVLSHVIHLDCPICHLENINGWV